MKTTPWFKAAVKPVRKGWYMVKGCNGYLDCNGMHYWNGKQWFYTWGSGADLIPFKALPWKGVVK